MKKLYLISGDDDFAIKLRSREIITSLCGEDADNNPDLEIIKGDSDELKPEDILTSMLASLHTPPFLSPDKKIWLRHFMHFEKSLAVNAKDVVKKRINELVDFIKAGIPDDIILIIDGPGIDQRKAFFKSCKAAPDSEVQIFKKTSFGDRNFAENQRRLINDICSKAGKQIDQAAVYYLTETISGDSGRMQSELEKVFCYIGDSNRVSLEDCKAICSSTPEAMSWDFANALVDRNMTAALKLVSTLVKQLTAERGGNLELSILSQATRSFQEMIKTKNAMAELNAPARIGKSYFSAIPQSIKEKYPDNMLLKIHPFRAYKICESAEKFSDKQLAQALRDILDANRKLVSGGGQPRIVLEQLITNITGKNAQQRY
jgi:DNA polymerase III delta subunit